MKVLLGVLVALLLVLQYRLWFGDGSIQEVWRLREETRASRAELVRLNQRNQALAAEVADLKSGLEAIEERARADLGMLGEGETFYQFVHENSPGTSPEINRDNSSTTSAPGDPSADLPSDLDP